MSKDRGFGGMSGEDRGQWLRDNRIVQVTARQWGKTDLMRRLVDETAADPDVLRGARAC